MAQGRSLWLAAALALVVSGCSVLQPEEAPSAPPPPPAAPSAPPPTVPQAPSRPAEPSTAAAWKPLLAKADQAARSGDYEQALALLERAQRIAPRSGEVYLQLARTHAARGDRDQAQAAAERGLLYCNSSAQCDALRALAR